MINENKIKLSGIACLSNPPKRTNIFVNLTIKNATLTGDKDIRGNEDETEDIIYKLKITPETEINILCENEILIAKKKGSQSQVLRQVIEEEYYQQFSGSDKYESADDYYKQEMIKIIKERKNRLL